MKDNGKLHAILPKETTTKLRKACLNVYASRYDPKDADILAMFFDVDKMEVDFQKKLNDSEPDDYRTLWNHIRGETDTTEERNSNLLAWLIDLEPRPRSSYYLNSDKTIKIGGIPIDDLPPSTPPPPIPPKSFYIPRFSLKYIIISCIILLFVGTTSFVAWENSVTSVRMPNADEKCMYWNEDHYEPVKCNAQIANATIIPLDLKKLQRQRKINLSDTLTSYSLGKVWYKGFVKDHEFFTAAGPYPTDTTRVLKKLSPIILAKYISNNRYLQTRLIWLSYAIIFVVLCGFGASRLKKEVKQPVKKSAAEEEEEPLNFTQQQPVNC
nr:hypothetical protein [uncultured Pedobacter sp.]